MKKLISLISLSLLFTLFAPLQSQAAETGTGPYRKVVANSGYSWMSTYVYLPGGNNVSYKKDSKDTGYVYIGGSNGGVEVDAGFQHSPTLDNWSPFISVNKVRPSTGTTNIRFKSNQEVFMKFYVTSDNNVELSVTGTDVDGVRRTITLTAKAAGMKKSGTGNLLKRVTSIAQVGGDNFNSGNYMKNVRWSQARIGTSSTANALWSGTHTKEFISHKNPYISVQYVNQSEETVSINLN
ncbi:YrpD family protein [Bacillus bombysepticus]|uniref:YrpD family protein n=1 Tax=Bacillus bombysepticus TaxID=658666 RepID=UPI003015CC37